MDTAMTQDAAASSGAGNRSYTGRSSVYDAVKHQTADAAPSTAKKCATCPTGWDTEVWNQRTLTTHHRTKRMPVSKERYYELLRIPQLEATTQRHPTTKRVMDGLPRELRQTENVSADGRIIPVADTSQQTTDAQPHRMRS